MTFLCTGSSGFIGKHLRKAVEKQGHTFIGVPRAMYLDPIHLERFIRDVKPDVIVHLASYGNLYQQKDMLEMLEVNYTGTFNLLQVLNDTPYKAFINVSSSSVELPYETFYSASKAGAERLVRAFADNFLKPAMTIRPHSVYGENDHPSHFIPTVFRSCLTGEQMTLAPEPVHDWVYVGDIVDAIMHEAKNVDKLVNHDRAVEVGTGIGKTNQQIVDIIERITGKKANVMKQKRIRPYDSDLWIADDSWNNDMIELEEGLQRYYKWYTREVK